MFNIWDKKTHSFVAPNPRGYKGCSYGLFIGLDGCVYMLDEEYMTDVSSRYSVVFHTDKGGSIV